MLFRFSFRQLLLGCALCWYSPSVFAQSPSLSQTITVGDIAWQVKHPIALTLTNKSTTPFHIVKIESDCNCTQAQWSKENVLPEGTQKVLIDFDAQVLGSFQKQIRIYTSNQQIHTYELKGRVLKETEIKQSLPVQMGDLAVSSRNIDFNDIKQGEIHEKTIYVRNDGNKAYMPILMLLPKYLTAYAQPELLRPGRTGKILLTLNSNELDTYGLTQSNIYLSKERGERVGKQNEFNVSATLLPHIEAADLHNPLQATISVDSLIYLGKFEKKNKLRGQLLISNSGKSVLNIYRVQVQAPGLSVSISKSTLQPGETATLKITLQRPDTIAPNERKQIVLISNDTKQPKQCIEVVTE